MSKETVKAQIDIDITNKTSSKSISPLNVGQNMKNVVDLIPDFGGTQNLQSVLTEGNTTITPIIITDVVGTQIVLHNTGFGIIDSITNEGVTTLTSGMLMHKAGGSGGQNSLNLVRSTLGTVEYSFPEKPSGNYILATLDDIKKIDLTGRIYANNASAISGGLTTNDVYRTSTGELRIVV